MGSDSSHEFGEFMGAVMYILLFALAIGFGIVMVKDAIIIGRNYDVQQYLVLNAILSALHTKYYENGRYYLSRDFINTCTRDRNSFESCLGIHLTGDYGVTIYGNQQMLSSFGILKGYTFKVPILIKDKNKKEFGYLIIKVGE